MVGVAGMTIALLTDLIGQLFAIITLFPGLLFQTCKAVKMVNELLLWRTGYLLANCFQELITNLKMQFLSI